MKLIDQNNDNIADWLQKGTDEEWMYTENDGWEHVSQTDSDARGPTAKEIREAYDYAANQMMDANKYYTSAGIPNYETFDKIAKHLSGYDPMETSSEKYDKTKTMRIASIGLVHLIGGGNSWGTADDFGYKVASLLGPGWNDGLDEMIEERNQPLREATEELKPIVTEQYGLKSLLRLYSVASTVSSHRKDINYAAEKYDVPAELIGSIIFKEQLTKSAPDDVAIFLKKHVLDGEASVGLGAIKAETARSAWQNYFEEDSDLPETDDELLKVLKNDDRFNIEMIALINIQNAQTVYGNNVNWSNLSNREWKEVLPYYNSSMSNSKAIELGNKYAEYTFSYFPVIRRLLDN